MAESLAPEIAFPLWKEYIKHGTVPQNALRIGWHKGKEVYVGKIIYDDEVTSFVILIPRKEVRAIKRPGRKYRVSEILCKDLSMRLAWKKSKNVLRQRRALSIGRNLNGEKTCIGRSLVNGVWALGLVSSNSLLIHTSDKFGHRVTDYEMLVAKRIRRPAILMDATVSVVAQQVNNLSSQNSMDTTVSVVSSEQVSVVALEQVNNSSSQNSMNISVASGSRPFRVIQHVVNGVASLFRQSLKNFMANVAGEVDENVGDNKDEEVDEGEVNPAKICSICLTIKSNCVLYKCGHTRFCFECANMQWKTPGRGTCPICKACIEDVVRTF